MARPHDGQYRSVRGRFGPADGDEAGRELGAAAPAREAADNVGPGSAVRDGGAPPRRAGTDDCERRWSTTRIPARAWSTRSATYLSESEDTSHRATDLTRGRKSQTLIGAADLSAPRSLSMPRRVVRWMGGSVGVAVSGPHSNCGNIGGNSVRGTQPCARAAANRRGNRPRVWTCYANGVSAIALSGDATTPVGSCP